MIRYKRELCWICLHYRLCNESEKIRDEPFGYILIIIVHFVSLFEKFKKILYFFQWEISTSCLCFGTVEIIQVFVLIAGLPWIHYDNFDDS